MNLLRAVDSNVVLWGQTVIYTSYVIVIMALVGWFAYRVTHEGESRIHPKYFYSFVAFLTAIGMSIHLLTYNTIPWVRTDLHGHNTPTAQQFEFKVADHKFQIPDEQMNVKCGELIEFNVLSEDLTYGFGLFREDNSMVFQMQVIPGHDNIIKWKFVKNEILSIRSTEYSGTEGYQMIKKNVLKVAGCQE